MFKTYKATFCLSLLTFTFIWSKEQSIGASYNELKYAYMCSQGIDTKNVVSEPEKKEEVDFSLPKLGKQEQALKIYDILQHVETDYFFPSQLKPEQQASLDILYRDLELFCGDGTYPEANIAGIIDRTWSSAGSAVLRKMLTNPLASSDPNKFEARQNLIKKFVADEELLLEADALCRQWAENEERMLTNWLETDAVSNDVVNNCYYQQSWLKEYNNNPYAMETLTRLGNLGTSIQFGGDLIITTAVEIVLVKLISGLSFKDSAQALFNTYKGMFEPLSIPFRCLAASAYGGLRVYQAKKAYDAAKQTKDAINFLQEKMISMSNVISSIQALQALGNEYAAVTQGLVSWQHVNNLLHYSENNDFAKLVKLLDTSTFTGEASFFSLSGRVLAAYELMQAQKNNFAGAVEVMGELDACISVAKLYRQFAERRVNFCFADLRKADTPYIDIKSFWNPFVDHNVVVTNDIQLGGMHTEQNVVLTGSNTGGKSTVGLKGTLISLYLAHTLGIAPAEVCSSSIFTDFSSYLHILDSVALGESAFQAEINRAQSLIKAVNSLQEDEFAFIVIDELFKGTSPEKGAPGAYKVIKHLASRSNVVFIIATHFKLLTELEQEMNSVRNMKLDIYEDEDGNLVKPYKLEKGISTQNIADILMESGLDIQDLDFE
ncbi:MAG: hypothetical protein WD055_05060 [Candidatus Dependentiae bacterium]